MKKIIFILVVLMLAAPAWARVDITCAQVGETNEVVVSFNAEPGGAVEPNLIRAFALDIKLDTDANIVDVNDEVNTDYWVFPGSYPGGEARADWEEYDGTLGEEPNQMTTEQGSLYYPTGAGSPNAPGKSGDLYSFRINASTGTHQVTIAENDIRGGVVSERIVAVPAYEPDVDCIPCTVTLPAACTYPACWDYLAQCHGDATGDGAVNTSDWPALRDSFMQVYPAAGYNPCADYNRDGAVNTSDWPALRDNFMTTPPADCPTGDLNNVYCP